MNRIKCPKCGCDKLDYWLEEISTNYYEIGKDGFYDINSKPIHTSSGSGYGASGYRCKRCDCEWNDISGNIIYEGDDKYENK